MKSITLEANSFDEPMAYTYKSHQLISKSDVTLKSIGYTY